MRPRQSPRGVHQQHNVKGKVREQYWPGTLMGLGIFVALGSLFTVATWTLLDPMMLLRVFLVLCFAGNLLPYLRSGLWLGMARLEWFLFNLLAVGPIGTSALLWLNFLAHGPTVTAEHVVKSVESDRNVITYHFVDHHLDEFWFARSAYRDWFPIVGNGVRITEADGLLGVRVVVEKEPVVIGH
ncbi:MAG: hypothetical protein IPG92_15810 [Flavobacteriales bacterium]|nr:hypothetical protein [Flavobacteriales bacterium]